MSGLIHLASRVLFTGAFILAGLAVWERLANICGYTVIRGVYSPARLLEFAAVILLFVIALQLREIKVVLGTRDSG